MIKFATDSLQDYLTDSGLETEGVKVQITDQIFIRVRRAGGQNREYDRALAKRSRPHLRRIQSRSMSNSELRDQVLLPTYLDAVVVGWEGVRDEEGREVPFSREAAEEFLRAFPNVFDTLIEIAGEMSTFRQREMEEAADSLGES